jgi:NAD+ kinase
MREIALYGRSVEDLHRTAVIDFVNQLIDAGFGIWCYETLLETEGFDFSSAKSFGPEDSLPESIEFIFSIGGDGTLLDATVFSRRFNIPILGLNTGRLGFLAALSTGDLSSAIKPILNKEYHYEERAFLMLKTEDGLFGDLNFALNELTLHKKNSSSMIKIHASIGDEFLNFYWADGLIISTPTGSTAYSLSCGGPIIMPGSNNFVITPIAPHNLNVRPIVVPDDREIKLNIEGRDEDFLVSLDSRSESIEAGKELVVMLAKEKLKLVAIPGYSYLKTIRRKLNWGLDIRN